MTRLRGLAVVAAAALAAAAAPARAAWSPPERVGTGAPATSAAVAPGMLALGTRDRGAPAVLVRAGARSRSAAASFGLTIPLGPGPALAGPDVALAGAAGLAAWAGADGVRAARGGGFDWGRPEDVMGGPAGEVHAALAPGGRGVVLAVAGGRVSAATQDRDGAPWADGGTLQAPVPAPAVALGPSGDALVAWEDPDRPGRVLAARRGAADAGWGAPEVVAEGPDVTDPVAAVGAGGGAAVAWSAAAPADFHLRGAGLVVATRPPGAATWEVSGDLAPGQRVEWIVSRYRVGVDARGGVTSAWVSGVLRGWRVWTARRPPGGAWRTAPAPVTAPADERLAVLAVVAAGPYAVPLWRHLRPREGTGRWGVLPPPDARWPGAGRPVAGPAPRAVAGGATGLLAGWAGPVVRTAGIPSPPGVHDGTPSPSPGARP